MNNRELMWIEEELRRRKQDQSMKTNWKGRKEHIKKSKKRKK